MAKVFEDESTDADQKKTRCVGRIMVELFAITDFDNTRNTNELMNWWSTI